MNVTTSDILDLEGTRFVNAVRVLIGLGPIPTKGAGKNNAYAREAGLQLVRENATYPQGCRRVGPGASRFPWGPGMSHDG